MLLLTEDGIIVARDKWGRTPIIIGKKDGAYAATSESSSLPNLDYEIDRFVGPGEILRLRAPSERADAGLLFPLGVLRFPGFLLRGQECRGGPFSKRLQDGEEGRERSGLCLRYS